MAGRPHPRESGQQRAFRHIAAVSCTQGQDRMAGAWRGSSSSCSVAGRQDPPLTSPLTLSARLRLPAGQTSPAGNDVCVAGSFAVPCGRCGVCRKPCLHVLSEAPRSQSIIPPGTQASAPRSSFEPQFVCKGRGFVRRAEAINCSSGRAAAGGVFCCRDLSCRPGLQGDEFVRVPQAGRSPCRFIKVRSTFLDMPRASAVRT